MANQNGQNPNIPKGAMKLPTPVLTTVGGYQPVIAVYYLPADAFTNDILELARQYVQDFEMCTIMRETVRGEEDDATDIPIGYLWINANSSAITNDVGKKNADLLPIKFTEYSPKMAEFINKYGTTDSQKRRRLKEAANFPNLRAVQIDLKKILDAMFDLHGEKYQKEYGVRPYDTDIEYFTVWSKRDPSMIEGFTIQKSLQNRTQRGIPIPKSNSFKKF